MRGWTEEREGAREERDGNGAERMGGERGRGRRQVGGQEAGKGGREEFLPGASASACCAAFDTCPPGIIGSGLRAQVAEHQQEMAREKEKHERQVKNMESLWSRNSPDAEVALKLARELDDMARWKEDYKKKHKDAIRMLREKEAEAQAQTPPSLCPRAFVTFALWTPMRPHTTGPAKVVCLHGLPG